MFIRVKVLVNYRGMTPTGPQEKIYQLEFTGPGHYLELIEIHPRVFEQLKLSVMAMETNPDLRVMDWCNP